MMRKLIILIIAIFAFSGHGYAETIISLKSICNKGEMITITQDYLIEGVVVSDWRSPNMELNPSITVNRLNVYVNDATAYVQDLDGNCGIRLLFEESADNRLCYGDKVTINVKGCRLMRSQEPDCLSLSGVSWLNIIASEPGHQSDIPLKEKYISDLNDSDVYTFVSLKDMEFVFKNGSYADVYEKHSVYCSSIHKGVCETNGRMDGWASLLRDSQGSCIYMLVNMLCEWRRNGRGVPQGVGCIDGVIVHTPMRRYGGDMGQYSIRPLDESNIRIAKKLSSNWKRLTAWMQDGLNGQTLDFEMLGLQDGLYKNGRQGDRVLNDSGPAKGYLWTDSGAYIHVASDLNSLSAEKEGFVPNGAILFKGSGTDWYLFDRDGNASQETKSILIEFDARKAKGEFMSINFTWLAGNMDGENNWGFPAQWKVQFSLDGQNWTTLEEAATGSQYIHLRPHPWMDKKLDGFGMRRTGFDTAMGMQQRSFKIPGEAFGQKSVMVRITPAGDIYYAHRGDPRSSSVDPNKRIKAAMTNTVSMIRFGEISVDYK